MGVPIGMVSLHAIATFLRIAFAERIHTTTTAGQNDDLILLADILQTPIKKTLPLHSRYMYGNRQSQFF